jgi:hypothetical protein
MPRKPIRPPLCEPDGDSSAFEPYAGLGSEHVRLRDLGWYGADFSLDPDELLKPSADIVLGMLAAAIISTFPSTEASPAATRSAKEQRCETAVGALMGSKPARGRPPIQRTEILLEISRRYFHAYYFASGTETLDGIIFKVLVARGDADEDLDPQSKEDRVRPFRIAFNANKDRLLAAMTVDGDERQRQLVHGIETIRGILRDFGGLGPGDMQPAKKE